MSNGTIYTETVVHSAPEQYVSEAPYQIAIVSLDDGGRVTARIAGARVSIGDKVHFVEYRNQFPVFEK
jgi:uncharacterized OB-fold protein